MAPVRYLLRNRLFIWFIFLLNTFSLTAQVCYQEPNCCAFSQPCSPCFKQSCLSPNCIYLLAAAALGAAAGAGTGYLAGHDRGPRGQNFQVVRDQGQSLTFTFSGMYMDNISSESQPSFFVTLPDQTTLEFAFSSNPTSNIPSPSNFSNSIFVTNPPFGLYSAGIRLQLFPQVPFTPGDTITVSDFNITVTASRNDSITTIENGGTVTLNFVNPGDPNQAQFAANFTYDNLTTP